MDKIIIEGGNRLFGEVEISGAKNAALPIMASSILLDSPVKIKNVPDLRDIRTFDKLLKILGAETNFENNIFEINATSIKEYTAPYDLVKTMRASILFLGPLVTKFGKAKVSLPGGCAIGPRPVNFHIDAIKKLGAKVNVIDGYIIAEANKLKGTEFYFDIPSVTGTENLVMAATLAKGKTVIKNAAKEPEVVDMIKFLKKMGAKIEGEGTEIIEIEGVTSLKGSEYYVIPDRIETGTFIVAAGITNGNILIKNSQLDFLESVVTKLKSTGIEIEENQNGIRVKGNDEITAADVITMPYPGFPTDMQAQFMALMCYSTGVSVITETIFENRFMHAFELMRMGADIKIEGSHAIVKGKQVLYGAKLMASDLRASASLILAGLRAKGKTEVSRIYHLDRGYEKFEKKLEKLNAKIWREKE